MFSPRVAIVDTGVGNLFSISRALEYVGALPLVTSSPDELQRADRVVIPGVGSFASTMATLEATGLAAALRDFSSMDRPILGICLGMQLFMTEGCEDGDANGLGLLAGEVLPLPRQTTKGELLRIPHIGWSRVSVRDRSTFDIWTSASVSSMDVYFAHSYSVQPMSADAVVGYFTYGGHVLAGVIRHRNLWGVQFHPERSGPTGLSVLRRFVFDDDDSGLRRASQIF